MSTGLQGHHGRLLGCVVGLATLVGCSGTGTIGPIGGGPVPGGAGGQSGPGGGEPPTGAPPATLPPGPPPTITGTDPGRVTMHRLNRVEYANTVRDLLGTTLRPADDFLPDTTAAGFSNLADVLSLQVVNLQMYQSAAIALADDALGPQRAKNLTCDLATGDICVRSTVRALAKRAWRRPVTDAEVEDLMAVAAVAKAQGEGPEAGLKLAIQLVLISPHFLFRVELDPDPASPAPHALNDHEFASRLSYFLWSSMPDDELSAAADAGTLRDPAVLKAQITRMMRSPKAGALVENFGAQWLFARGLEGVAPDAKLFPRFDAPLRSAMLEETKLLFRDVAFSGLSTDQLLRADFTYVNDRLASHYGLPAVGSAELQKVPVAGTPRGGLLAQGSLLTVTSHADRTSPVNRGKAILTQLLCEDVPPPPEGVNTDLTEMTGTTVREQLESHRNNPKCASCHSLMDPLGFGLENFDAVGTYRDKDNGKDIDAAGNYPDVVNTRFSGSRELAALVAADERFIPCLTKQLYTYALGREPVATAGHQDPSTMKVLAYQHIKNGYKFEDLVQRLVASDTFLKRRGEAAPAGGAAP